MQGGAARVFCIPVAASTAGTIGEVAKTGDGSGSVTVQGLSLIHIYGLTPVKLAEILREADAVMDAVQGGAARVFCIPVAASTIAVKCHFRCAGQGVTADEYVCGGNSAEGAGGIVCPVP